MTTALPALVILITTIALLLAGWLTIIIGREWSAEEQAKRFKDLTRWRI